MRGESKSISYAEGGVASRKARAQVLRDPLWGDIRIPDARILATAPMARLQHIRQLGPTSVVYPGAVHTRLNHCLGVFAVASRLLASIKPGEQTREDRAFLHAALLHDVGHFPYTHALKQLIVREHEALGADAILANEELCRYLEEADVDPLLVAEIIDTERPASYACTPLYRGFLSGALDPDKLDYLNRDAYFSGVPYGVQDVDAIFRYLVLHDDKLVVKEKGRSLLEQIIFSKYMMYQHVYWHPRVRSATAMVQKGILSAMKAGELTEEDMYAWTDTDLLRQEHSRVLSGFVAELDAMRLYESLALSEDTARELCVREGARDPWARFAFEDALAEELGLQKGALIYDVPEPIHFEVPELLVGSEVLAYDGFMQGQTIEAMSHGLRKARIYIDPCVENYPDKERIAAAIKALS